MAMWMAQIARNMSMIFAEEKPESRPTHIIRDRDTKFTAQFCSILETDGIEFRPTPRRSPNLNPFAEAWVQKTKHEVLDHFIVFGEKHLRTILSERRTYYHCAFTLPHLAMCLKKGGFVVPALLLRWVSTLSDAREQGLGPAGLPERLVGRSTGRWAADAGPRSRHVRRRVAGWLH